MSNEIKAVSFRLREEEIQKFREIAEEQGLNQAEMFQSLMNSFEMAKAKGMITDRAKEIEVFQDTVNNLVSMFVNSLAINQSSEERIREVLSLELNTKDKMIAELQGYKEEVKKRLREENERMKELEKTNNELQVLLSKATKELEEKSSAFNMQQEQISTLNSIITEYKAYKDENKELELKNNELNNRITDTLQSHTEVLHINSDLKAKIENLENMKEFYKTEVDSLKQEVKELNTNIKKIEEDNKNEFKSIQKAHREEIKTLVEEYKDKALKAREELLMQFKEDIKNKLQIEKSKYEIELEKAKNKEELFKAKYEELKEKQSRATGTKTKK